MEVYPLKNLNDLLFWDEPKDLKPVVDELLSLQKKSIPVQLPQSFPEFQYKTLICHDLNGGYLDDRFCYGCKNNEAYRFYHWYGIDIFIYFSHHFITIPPCGWIQTAHMHGVKVLGTMITEWNAGSNIWDEILSDDEIFKIVIQNLIKIAAVFKFEGWLLNIECEIKPNKVDKLIEFAKELCIKMREVNPDSEVIWYDSVTSEGKLQWQNELNKLNQCFFDVCDGIFLNYCWDEKKLAKSLQTSKERHLNVYVGIDVFGRGCFGGGGFNSHKALQLIRKYNLSVAIFAQGWTYKNLGNDNFFSNENKMWAALQPYLLFHGPTKLPLSTSFCQGFGKNYFNEGQIAERGTWFNLMRQQIQPLWEEFSRSGVLCSYNTENAYNGGSCTSFWIDEELKLMILLCEIKIVYPIELELVYKVKDIVDNVAIELVIQENCEPNPNNWRNYSFECNYESVCGEKNCIESVCGENNCIAPFREIEINAWTLKKFILEEVGGVIRSINLCAKGTGLLCLGNFSITEKI